MPLIDTLSRNPSLDVAEAASVLARDGRIQLHDFLEPDGAESVHQALSNHSPWYLSFNRGAENLEVPASNLDKAPAAQQAEFMRRVHDRAGRQFQYLFKQYYISEAIRRKEEPGCSLHAVHHFLNGPDMLDFFRLLSSEAQVGEVDVLASRYEGGHFLTMHDDRHATRDRVAAYVLNLTPDWNPNWGGHLAFFDDLGNIEQAFVPRFNTLNVFLVPKSHAVQLVAPFARRPRLSITGWLHRLP